MNEEYLFDDLDSFIEHSPFVDDTPRMLLEIIWNSARVKTEVEEVKKGINPPEGGWKDNTWYLVEVKMKSNNPPHKHLYYTGFDNNGYSGGFPIHYAPNNDRSARLNEYYYLKVIKEIDID